jgi:hypothetical protein
VASAAHTVPDGGSTVTPVEGPDGKRLIAGDPDAKDSGGRCSNIGYTGPSGRAVLIHLPLSPSFHKGPIPSNPAEMLLLCIKGDPHIRPLQPIVLQFFAPSHLAATAYMQAEKPHDLYVFDEMHNRGAPHLQL